MDCKSNDNQRTGQIFLDFLRFVVCVQQIIFVPQKAGFSVEINHRNARSAELYMLVAEVRNIGDSGQVLAYQLAQDA